MTNAIIELTTRAQKKYIFSVSSALAKAVITKHHEGGCFFCIENGQGFSIDFKNIMAVKAENLEENIPQKQEKIFPATSTTEAAKRLDSLVENKPAVSPCAESQKKMRFIPGMNPRRKDGIKFSPEDDIDLQTEMMIAAGKADELTLYKAECKCGHEKFYSIPYAHNTYTKCRECGEQLFYDAKADCQNEHGDTARLMTNKYFVEAE